MIKSIFDFEYTWEVYMLVAKRKYGHYVLPVIMGERDIGRIEAVADRKTNTLMVENIWCEDGLKPTATMKNAVEKSLQRFAVFNHCYAW